MTTGDPIDTMAGKDSVALACESMLVRLGAKSPDIEGIRVNMRALECVTDPARDIRAEVISRAREMVRGCTPAAELEKALATFDWMVDAAFNSERGDEQ